jgi:hypothetical protein
MMLLPAVLSSGGHKVPARCSRRHFKDNAIPIRCAVTGKVTVLLALLVHVTSDVLASLIAEYEFNNRKDEEIFE